MVCSDLHYEGEGQGYRRRRLGQDCERGKVFARSRGLPACDEWVTLEGGAVRYVQAMLRAVDRT